MTGGGASAGAGPAASAAPAGGPARALLVLSAAVALFYAPALLTGDQFMYRDTGRLHLPMKQFIAGELRRGRLPEWNPYFGLGAPVVAMGVDAPQHPFNLLLVLLPFQAGFKSWVLLSYLLAGMGGWLWARRLGAGFHAALAAGLAFAFSGFLVSSSDNLTYLTTLAALPLVFASLHGWLERGGMARLAALGGASALCAAGGDPMAWGFAMGLLPVYAVLFPEPRLALGRALRRGLVAVAVGAVAAAPFILPVVAWIPESSRGEPLELAEYLRYNLVPIRLAELFVPHVLRLPPGEPVSPVFDVYSGDAYTSTPWVLSVYLGIVAVWLAAFGAVASRRARLLLAGAALFAWMSMGHHAGFGQLARHLPVLGSFRYWEKLAAWPALLVAMASVFGFARLLSDRPAAGRFARAAGIAGLVALGARLAGSLLGDRLPRLLQRGGEAEAARLLAGNLLDGILAVGLVLLALGLVALALSRHAVPRRAPALLAAVVLLDVMAANVRGFVLAPPAIVEGPRPLARYLSSRPGLQRLITPFDLTAGRWPEMRTFESTWRWASHTLDAAWNVPRGVRNLRSYAGMMPVRESRFLRRIGLQRYLPNVGLWSVEYVVVPSDPSRARLVNLEPPWAVAAVDPEIPLFLLRIPHRPRVYLAGDLTAVDRRGAMEFALDAASTGSGRSVVEGEVPAGYAPPGGEARVVLDEPARVEVEARAGAPALLVLNDIFAAGWTARVDGAPAAIVAVNYLARGVWLGPGTHRVAFAYRTPLLRQGWMLCGAGALALAAWGLRRRRARPPAAGPGGAAAMPGPRPSPSPDGSLRGE